VACDFARRSSILIEITKFLLLMPFSSRDTISTGNASASVMIAGLYNSNISISLVTYSFCLDIFAATASAKSA